MANDLISALRSLGYSVAEAKHAISLIPADAPQDFEEQFKIALAMGAR